MSEQQQQSQQQQANRGILPSETLNALDYLVDRLNASSGHLPSTASVMPTNVANNASDSHNNTQPLPIRALLVGTNEGVGLSRSLGSAHTATQLQNPNDPNFSHSGSMSEEVLSSIETVWATIVSAVPPHVMAASAAGAAAAAAAAEEEANNNGGKGNEEKKADDEEDAIPPHIQPSHPLLSPLQMGDHIRTVTATYDNCTLMHVHMAPLVVTFVTLPEANIGAIRSVALPLLKILLEPVRRALVRSRGGGANAAPPIGSGNGNNNVVGGTGQQGGGGHMMTLEQQQQQQAAMAQQQQAAMAYMQQSQMQSQHQMDPALQQHLYQQQMQQMITQQQQQQQFQQ